MLMIMVMILSAAFLFCPGGSLDYLYVSDNVVNPTTSDGWMCAPPTPVFGSAV